MNGYSDNPGAIPDDLGKELLKLSIDGVREAIEQQNWSETQQQITAVSNAINKFSSYLDAL